MSKVLAYIWISAAALAWWYGAFHTTQTFERSVLVGMTVILSALLLILAYVITLTPRKS